MPQPPRRQRGARGRVAVCVALIVKQLAPRARRPRRARPPPPAAATPAPAATSSRLPAQAYNVIATRNLFSPDAHRDAAARRCGGARGPSGSPSRACTASCCAKGSPIAYLEDPITKRIAGYRIGDPIAGGTVQTISADAVVITRPTAWSTCACATRPSRGPRRPRRRPGQPPSRRVNAPATGSPADPGPLPVPGAMPPSPDAPPVRIAAAGQPIPPASMPGAHATRGRYRSGALRRASGAGFPQPRSTRLTRARTARTSEMTRIVAACWCWRSPPGAPPHARSRAPAHAAARSRPRRRCPARPSRSPPVVAQSRGRARCRRHRRRRGAPPPLPPRRRPRRPSRPAQRGRFVVLNFDNADIETVIQAASEIIGFNYVLAPDVRGKVTVQTSGRIAQEEVFGVLLAILEVHGFTAVKIGEPLQDRPHRGRARARRADDRRPDARPEPHDRRDHHADRAAQVLRRSRT